MEAVAHRSIITEQDARSEYGEQATCASLEHGCAQSAAGLTKLPADDDHRRVECSTDSGSDFFLTAAVAALAQWLIGGNPGMFAAVVAARFDMADLSVKVMLLFGTLTLRLGFLFLVLNASSLTLLLVTVFMYRAQAGAPDPTMVFLPILLATSASTLVGFLGVAFVQKLRVRDPGVLAWLGGSALLLGGFIALFFG